MQGGQQHRRPIVSLDLLDLSTATLCNSLRTIVHIYDSGEWWSLLRRHHARVSSRARNRKRPPRSLRLSREWVQQALPVLML